MEWLGVLLLYIISGYIKKRQQNEKRRQIESDPDWDSEQPNVQKTTLSDFDNLLNDLFEDNPKIPDSNPNIKDVLQKPVIKSEFDIEENVNENSTFIKESDLSDIDEQGENFSHKIYHSQLAKRDESRFGNKWKKKVNIRDILFQSKQSLKKSIIIKEILDKPLSLRK
ncbi:MAG: hypothetical protein CMG55_00795 [Candidatus Marinimicrobia bacterium]|nr:hypothetical protein [Candidatus Neomarinimicrobiota bacterium]|tara:strand:- start:4822 stop:5325 length:504 start_codon:yes stop_codon:yes gene_type:complete